MVNEFIMPVLVGAGMVFQVALAVDRWVHKQGYDGVKLAQELDEVKSDVTTLRRRFDDGTTGLSTKLGAVQRRLGTIELDVARLKALDEAAHRHYREGD